MVNQSTDVVILKEKVNFYCYNNGWQFLCDGILKLAYDQNRQHITLTVNEDPPQTGPIYQYAITEDSFLSCYQEEGVCDWGEVGGTVHRAMFSTASGLDKFIDTFELARQVNELSNNDGECLTEEPSQDKEQSGVRPTIRGAGDCLGTMTAAWGGPVKGEEKEDYSPWYKMSVHENVDHYYHLVTITPSSSCSSTGSQHDDFLAAEDVPFDTPPKTCDSELPLGPMNDIVPESRAYVPVSNGEQSHQTELQSVESDQYLGELSTQNGKKEPSYGWDWQTDQEFKIPTIQFSQASELSIKKYLAERVKVSLIDKDQSEIKSELSIKKDTTERGIVSPINKDQAELASELSIKKYMTERVEGSPIDNDQTEITRELSIKKDTTEKMRESLTDKDQTNSSELSTGEDMAVRVKVSPIDNDQTEITRKLSIKKGTTEKMRESLTDKDQTNTSELSIGEDMAVRVKVSPIDKDQTEMKSELSIKKDATERGIVSPINKDQAELASELSIKKYMAERMRGSPIDNDQTEITRELFTKKDTTEKMRESLIDKDQTNTNELSIGEDMVVRVKVSLIDNDQTEMTSELSIRGYPAERGRVSPIDKDQTEIKSELSIKKDSTEKGRVSPIDEDQREITSELSIRGYPVERGRVSPIDKDQTEIKSEFSIKKDSTEKGRVSPIDKDQREITSELSIKKDPTERWRMSPIGKDHANTTSELLIKNNMAERMRPLDKDQTEMKSELSIREALTEKEKKSPIDKDKIEIINELSIKKDPTEKGRVKFDQRDNVVDNSLLNSPNTVVAGSSCNSGSHVYNGNGAYDHGNLSNQLSSESSSHQSQPRDLNKQGHCQPRCHQQHLTNLGEKYKLFEDELEMEPDIFVAEELTFRKKQLETAPEPNDDIRTAANRKQLKREQYIKNQILSISDSLISDVLQTFHRKMSFEYIMQARRRNIMCENRLIYISKSAISSIIQKSQRELLLEFYMERRRTNKLYNNDTISISRPLSSNALRNCQNEMSFECEMAGKGVTAFYEKHLLSISRSLIARIIGESLQELSRELNMEKEREHYLHERQLMHSSASLCLSIKEKSQRELLLRWYIERNTKNNVYNDMLENTLVSVISNTINQSHDEQLFEFYMLKNRKQNLYEGQLRKICQRLISDVMSLSQKELLLEWYQERSKSNSKHWQMDGLHCESIVGTLCSDLMMRRVEVTSQFLVRIAIEIGQRELILESYMERNKSVRKRKVEFRELSKPQIQNTSEKFENESPSQQYQGEQRAPNSDEDQLQNVSHSTVRGVGKRMPKQHPTDFGKKNNLYEEYNFDLQLDTFKNEDMCPMAKETVLMSEPNLSDSINHNPKECTRKYLMVDEVEARPKAMFGSVFSSLLDENQLELLIQRHTRKTEKPNNQKMQHGARSNLNPNIHEKKTNSNTRRVAKRPLPIITDTGHRKLRCQQYFEKHSEHQRRSFDSAFSSLFAEQQLELMFDMQKERQKRKMSRKSELC